MGPGAGSAFAQAGAFQLEIRKPTADLVVPSRQTSVEVAGEAKIVGGLRKLDLFLVIDTSMSLRKTDPEDHRATGAVGLVKSLLWSDVNIGVVDFDRKTKLVSPLTADRAAVMEALRGLDQFGRSNPAAGIRMALEGFEESGRPGATRMMLLFTDGKLKEAEVRDATADAKEKGVSVSTVAFGSNESGDSILRQLAEGTGGSFVAVSDPAEIPDAFLNLRTSGIDWVELRVNDSEPVLAALSGSSFSAEVPLEQGANRIVATARSFDGREQEVAVAMTVRSPGCAELEVRVEHNGQPALSISNRAVEIVVDASGSMWGQMDGRTKIEIAKEILDGALDWLPPDLNLSLRAYGHRADRREQDCEDTELLVPPGSGNRAEIRSAIAGLQPKGQTPLGHSLAQVSNDFGDFVGERAVVLVTDGIESCGGDAPGEARALQSGGRVPVHVIGFGLGGRADADLAGLRAIADASGGRFVTAGSAAELRKALSTSVGTPYEVWRGEESVARGTLGGSEPIRLPAGEYRVRLESAPPHELPVTLASEEALTVVLQREEDQVLDQSTRMPAEYVACDETEPEAEPVEPPATESAESAE
jgi:Mg-chelatase subunit ChlD